MTWADFVIEFNRKFFNPTMMNVQQKKFLNIKQGKITVAVVVKKFDQLVRQCPYLVPSEEQQTKRMLEMFRLNIALAIESGGDQPTTIVACIERAYRAKYRLN